jgi:hypothetical protein
MVGGEDCWSACGIGEVVVCRRTTILFDLISDNVAGQSSGSPFIALSTSQVPRLQDMAGKSGGDSSNAIGDLIFRHGLMNNNLRIQLERLAANHIVNDPDLSLHDRHSFADRPRATEDFG